MAITNKAVAGALGEAHDVLGRYYEDVDFSSQYYGGSPETERAKRREITRALRRVEAAMTGLDDRRGTKEARPRHG